MTREEALKIIEDFGKEGGNLFIDGCKGEGMTDNDLFSIAKDCQRLMTAHKESKKLCSFGGHENYVVCPVCNGTKA